MHYQHKKILYLICMMQWFSCVHACQPFSTLRGVGSYLCTAVKVQWKKDVEWVKNRYLTMKYGGASVEELVADGDPQQVQQWCKDYSASLTDIPQSKYCYLLGCDGEHRKVDFYVDPDFDYCSHIQGTKTFDNLERLIEMGVKGAVDFSVGLYKKCNDELEKFIASKMLEKIVQSIVQRNGRTSRWGPGVRKVLQMNFQLFCVKRRPKRLVDSFRNLCNGFVHDKRLLCVQKERAERLLHELDNKVREYRRNYYGCLLKPTFWDQYINSQS